MVISLWFHLPSLHLFSVRPLTANYTMHCSKFAVCETSNLNLHRRKNAPLPDNQVPTPSSATSPIPQGVRPNASPKHLLLEHHSLCILQTGSYSWDGTCVFDAMPTRDGVSWHSLISGYAASGSLVQSVKAYDLMLNEGSFNLNMITLL